MNRMKEVAELFGLELNEEFDIKEHKYENPYKFCVDGLFDCDNCYSNDVLNDLLTGILSMEKKPFKPTCGNNYFYVDENGVLRHYYWNNTRLDFYLYNAGNCFKTKEEITPETKEKILREMKAKYEEV